ncbi:MAG: hypothetical protein ACLU8F_00765 [Clostridia bacterium]
MENEEENNNLKVLKELHKAAKMGMDSISFVSKKVQDDNFKTLLSNQYNNYGNVVVKTNDIYHKFGELPNNNDIKDKVMGWTGVQMNTINDKSNSHIADMLIQGTNMGIVEGKKLLNHYPNIDQEIKDTLQNFIQMQEDNIQELKPYL